MNFSVRLFFLTDDLICLTGKSLRQNLMNFHMTSLSVSSIKIWHRPSLVSCVQNLHQCSKSYVRNSRPEVFQVTPISNINSLSNPSPYTEYFSERVQTQSERCIWIWRELSMVTWVPWNHPLEVSPLLNMSVLPWNRGSLFGQPADGSGLAINGFEEWVQFKWWWGFVNGFHSSS